MQRAKNKSMTDLVVDYSKSNFECVVSKQKFLGTTKRFLYIFDSYIVLNKEQKKKRPDCMLLVELTKRVVWKYCENKQPGRKTLKGFSIDYVNKSHQYFAEEQVLKQIKMYFARLYFQAKVQDEYEAQCVVGQGNYALVLELRHLHSDIKLASKCIDKRKLDNVEQGMKSVLNEIKIMRALSPHLNIVNLHEVYDGDNNIYLIMDLAEGGSLYQEMKNRKYLFTRKEIQQIMKALLTALSYMHSKGVMHRDLKPENILYQTKGDYDSLKLADFGLSAFAHDYPYLYPKCGTPGFVAPEVANLIDKTTGYSFKCDVFSSGVIFHVLLFGEGLFTGSGHQEILKLNKICEINYLHKKYEAIDQDAKDLLFQLIEKDPTKRISTTQGLQHSFFTNDPMKYAPEASKENIMENGQLKPLTPGCVSPFHNYMQAQNTNRDEPDLKTPDQSTMTPLTIHLREKQNSIITRTPIYKEQKPQQKDKPFSDFALDKDYEEVIVEESKECDEDEEGIRQRLNSLQLQKTSSQFDKK